VKQLQDNYAAIAHTVKGLNATFKYFERKMKIE